MRNLSALTALSLLAGAGAAHAQGPSLELSLVSSPAGSGLPHALPPGESAAQIACLGPGRVLIHAESGRNFVADGRSLSEVCRPGATIPGQAPRVWGAQMPAPRAFPLRDGRPPVFILSSSGPGVVRNQPRAFSGDPAGPGPFWMSAPDDALTLSFTPTGLAVDTSYGVLIGPIGGAPHYLITSGRGWPGLGLSLSDWSNLRVNGDGAVLGLFEFFLGPDRIGVAADNSFHTVAEIGGSLPTDRGPFTISQLAVPQLQPIGDGSAMVYDPAAYDGHHQGEAIFLVPPAGPASVVITDRDHAPGCPRGFTVEQIGCLAASRSGNVLWHGTILDHDRLDGYGLFLWSHGRSRLLLRTFTPVAGSQGRLAVSPPQFYHLYITAQVDDAGRVALILPYAGSGAVYLYTPEAGTVEAFRAEPTFSGMADGVPITLTAFGSDAANTIDFFSGGDDDRPYLMGPGGSITFNAAGSAAGAQGRFAMTARIADPGARAEYTADGFLDFFDYAAFLECFNGGACPNGKDGDFNNDGTVDLLDYADYVDAFEHGR